MGVNLANDNDLAALAAQINAAVKPWQAVPLVPGAPGGGDQVAGEQSGRPPRAHRPLAQLHADAHGRARAGQRRRPPRRLGPHAGRRRAPSCWRTPPT